MSLEVKKRKRKKGFSVKLRLDMGTRGNVIISTERGETFVFLGSVRKAKPQRKDYVRVITIHLTRPKKSG